MQISESKMKEFATMIATAVVDALEKNKYISNDPHHKSKNAYQKTEQLLYNYNNFKKIIKDKELEIETIRTYGVPQKSTSIVGFSPKTNLKPSMTLEEDVVQCAINTVQESIYDTVQVINMIDKAMVSLKNDPYYGILEMTYFEGRKQEDIALHYGVSQVTISNNKRNLVRALSMRLFPNQAILEML